MRLTFKHHFRFNLSDIGDVLVTYDHEHPKNRNVNVSVSRHGIQLDRNTMSLAQQAELKQAISDDHQIRRNSHRRISTTALQTYYHKVSGRLRLGKREANAVIYYVPRITDGNLRINLISVVIDDCDVLYCLGMKTLRYCVNQAKRDSSGMNHLRLTEKLTC